MRGFTIAVFIVLGMTMVLMELGARLGFRRIPTLGRVLDWALRRRSAQLGMVMAWWWIGWHFLASGG